MYLQQLIQGNDVYRLREQNKALSIVKSRLQQKYDVSQEFTETLPWTAATQYAARSRVIIDYDAWVASTAYVIGNCVIHSGTGYVCTIANSDATFTTGNWASLSVQYSLYFCSYPPTCTYPADLANPNAPVFNVNKPYNEGDIVYWKGYTYVCMIASCRISQQQMIQYYTIGNLPYLNVFPDDTVNNAENQFWGTKTAYSVPVGTKPTNTTYWMAGDNREQQAVDAMRWCVIHGLAPLISPKVVPENWTNNYYRVLESLDMMKNGGITVDIPLLQPSVGMRIRYGGNVKLPNMYGFFWFIFGIKIIAAITLIVLLKNFKWSKVEKPFEKPPKWWYRKVLCEVGCNYFGSSSNAYHSNLQKLCSMGYNLYGQPCLKNNDKKF